MGVWTSKHSAEKVLTGPTLCQACQSLSASCISRRSCSSPSLRACSSSSSKPRCMPAVTVHQRCQALCSICFMVIPLPATELFALSRMAGVTFTLRALGLPCASAELPCAHTIVRQSISRGCPVQMESKTLLLLCIGPEPLRMLRRDCLHGRNGATFGAANVASASPPCNPCRAAER